MSDAGAGGNLFDRRTALKLAASGVCAFCAGGLRFARAQPGGVYCSAYGNDSEGRNVRDLTLVDETVGKFLATDMLLLQKFFELKGSLLGSDGLDNAFASLNPGDNPAADGKIVFGNVLIDRIKNKPFGLLNLAGILAHETSHLYQYGSGDYTYLMDGCGPHNKPLVELQADYLAGGYMASRAQLMPGAPEDLSKLFFSLGDDQLTNPDFHGTRGQRLAAFYEGYTTGKQLIDAGKMDRTRLAASGVLYVRTACNI
jgi:hypothetical protein